MFSLFSVGLMKSLQSNEDGSNCVFSVKDNTLNYLSVFFIVKLVFAASGCSVIRNNVTYVINARDINKKSFKAHTKA